MPKEDTTIYLISLIIIVAVVIIILTLLIQSKLNDTVSTFYCLPGQCKIDIFTGNKICPESQEQLKYNPEYQACSSKFICDNPDYPYAVQSDLSTNENSSCQEGSSCKCLAYSACPFYVTSVFQTNQGNPYTYVSGQRLSFTQTTKLLNQNVNSFSSSTNNTVKLKELVEQAYPTVTYSNPQVNFCSLPSQYIYLSSPGCRYGDTIAECMNSDEYNPCLEGVLAFITDNYDSFNESSMQNGLLSCVSGTKTNDGSIKIYDTSYGGLLTKNI